MRNLKHRLSFLCSQLLYILEWNKRLYIALPGASEHQLGLAVDINADTSKCSSDDVYKWLLENSYKYGFIQRYPSGKTSITGVANEPWHYRYVGKEAAAEILYPKAETTNVQMELKPLRFGLF